MRRLVVFLGLITLLAIPAVAMAGYDYPSGGPSMGGTDSPGGGDSGPPMGGTMPTLVEDGEVTIVDFAFQPRSVAVAPGSTVDWRNAGAAPHTVTAFNGAFDSGTIDSGGGFSTTFSDPGIYMYQCTIHPNMVGTVNVSGT